MRTVHRTCGGRAAEARVTLPQTAYLTSTAELENPRKWNQPSCLKGCEGFKENAKLHGSKGIRRLKHPPGCQMLLMDTFVDLCLQERNKSTKVPVIYVSIVSKM